MINRMVNRLARVLLTLLRGVDADVLRGDIEEQHRQRHATDPYGAGRALLRDVTLSLCWWWRPSSVLRRQRLAIAATRQLHMHSHKDALMSSIVSSLLSDVRLTIRGCTRRLGFTLTVVLTFAVGIGATTTIYSVVDSVVLRQLPYSEAERLVALGNTFPGREWRAEVGDLQALAGVSLLNFQEWERRARSFDRLGAAERTSMLLPSDNNGPELATLGMVTDGFFDVLRVRPLLGRLFLPDDFTGTNGPVVLLSYETWINRFGGDATVVGASVQSTGRQFVVVGVLPKGFIPPESFGTTPLEFWSPLDASHPRYQSRGRRSLVVFGRLAPHATVATAREEIAAIQLALGDEFPDGNVFPDGERFSAGANALLAETVGGSQRLLLIFLGASALLLIIAALNAANLLLVRGLDRQAEMNVRRALGATRGTLARLLFLESVLLALTGGIVGIGVAFVGIKAFLLLAPASLPRLAEVAVNPRVLVMTVLLSVGAGLLVGLLPALRLTGHDIVTAMRSQGGNTSSSSGIRVRSVMMAGQLSMAVILAVGASLLMNSFFKLSTVDPGFNPSNLTAFSMPMKRPGAPVDQPSWQSWDALLTEIRAVPGVTGAAAGSNLPFQSPNWAPGVLLPGDDPTNPRRGIAGYAITPNYFEVASIRVVAGRVFSTNDRATSTAVVIVNEKFVADNLNGAPAVGSMIRIRGDDGAPASFEIVGVVADVIQTRAEEGAKPAVYVPYTQADWPMAQVMVRSSLPASSIMQELRRAAARFSPAVPVIGLSEMTSRVSTVQTEPRFRAVLVGLFAAIAVLLAAIGLYGTLAYSVSRRRREIGIRMALGAQRGGIFRLILRQGLTVTGAGVMVGLAGSLLLTRLLQSFLFGVEPLDVVSFGVALLVLLAAMLLAIVIPSRRATGVDVVASLRSE